MLYGREEYLSLVVEAEKRALYKAEELSRKKAVTILYLGEEDSAEESLTCSVISTLLIVEVAEHEEIDKEEDAFVAVYGPLVNLNSNYIIKSTVADIDSVAILSFF
jgi:hypothetical protein